MRALARRLPRPLKAALRNAVAWSEHGLFQVVRPYFAVMRARRRRAAAALAGTQRPVILFLAPEAGLTPFFGIHAVMARSAQEAGHAAIVLSCDGLLPTCSWKMASGAKPQAAADRDSGACRSCRRAALRGGNAFGLADIAIESLLGMRERSLIAAILAENSAAPWATTYDGIAFGDAALGQTLRDCRKLDAGELSADDRVVLCAILYSALAVYLAVKALKTRYSLRRIVFCGTYAYWLPAMLFAQKHAIGVSEVEHVYNRDVDRRGIVIRQRGAHDDLIRQIERWPRYRNRPIEPSAVAAVADGSLYRLWGHGGVSTHSPNWARAELGALRASLGLSPERKTIVAYSSSADEFIAGHHILRACGLEYPQGPKPFDDNATWLRALIEWAGARSDLQLIVRLHPRLMARRGHPVSTEYGRLRQSFADTPANVAVIWPEDRVSSYNLAEIADAVAVAWSTIGLELARFGLPCVAAFRGIGSFPTGSFIAFEETRSRYFAGLEKALDRPASLAAITEAYRWTHFLFLAPSVDVSDLVPGSDYDGMPRAHTPKNHQTITHVLVDDADLCALNMARLPQGAAAEAAEREAMLRAISRCIVALVVGEDRPAEEPRLVQCHSDRSVSLELNGNAYRRHSPMAHRLAAVLQHAVRYSPAT